MKKLIAIVALVTGLATGNAFAAGTVTATATVDLTILSAFSVNIVTSTISLGTIYQGTTTASVDPINGGASAAAFSLDGPNSTPVTFSWPSSITLSNGTDNGTFAANVTGNIANTQTSSTSLTNGGPAVNTAGSGTTVYYFWVGGTATVPAAASAGAYTGSVTVTVTY